MGADERVWHALARPRFLLTSWPWRSLGYLASTVPVGGAALLALGLLAGVGAVTAVALVGIPLLVMAVLAGIPIGSLERHRIRLLRAGPVPDPHPPVVAQGLWEWVRTRLAEAATWRELAYALLLALVLWPLDVLVLAGCGLRGSPGRRWRLRWVDRRWCGWRRPATWRASLHGPVAAPSSRPSRWRSGR